jgi:hypothetical protein
MAKKQLIVSALSQMPAPVKKLWGPPPILRSEDPAVYWKLGLAMAEAVQPADSIEWMYLKDVVDYTWEIRRLRKYQVQLIAIQERTFLSEARKLIPPKEMKRWKELVETGQYETEMFLKDFAPRLRKASDDIIEGEFIEHDPVRGAPRGVPAAKAAGGRGASDGWVAEGLGNAAPKVAGREDSIMAGNDPDPAAPAGGAAVTGPGSGAGRDGFREAAADPTRREVA